MHTANARSSIGANVAPTNGSIASMPPLWQISPMQAAPQTITLIWLPSRIPVSERRVRKEIVSASRQYAADTQLPSGCTSSRSAGEV